MTTDSNDTLERIARRVPVPDSAYERILHRRDRKRRNQRITAGIVGIAFFIATVVVVGAASLSDNAQGPAGGGETGPAVTGPAETGTDNGQAPTPRFQTWVVTEQDLALGESLLDAWVAGDGETIASAFSGDGTFDGFEPTVLSALHDWFRAGGWTFRGERCGRHVDTAEEDDLGLGYVGCGFSYENDVTRALEMPLADGGLALYMDDGRVTTASTRDARGVSNLFRSPDPEREDLFGPVWDTFIAWIASTHPEDFELMYDPVAGYPRLDPTSIELWRLYTDEFIDSEVLRSVEESFEFQARRICKNATDELWTTIRANHLARAGAEVWNSTLAGFSEERLAQLRALPLATEADRATMDAFVPIAEELTELFRQAKAGAGGNGHYFDLMDRVRLENELNELIPGCWFSLGA